LTRPRANGVSGSVGSTITHRAVTVVPMPCLSGSSSDARKIVAFASTTEATRSERYGWARSVSPEPIGAGVQAFRMVLTVISLATSPAWCPPMPSATTRSHELVCPQSSFCARTRPGSEQRDAAKNISYRNFAENSS